MHILSGSCVLLLWTCTLTFVKSQECTREAFVKSRLYDSNFDVSDLEEKYPAGKQIRVNCNIGYSGFYRILCIEGKWQARGSKCEPKQCGHPGDAQFADFHLEKGDDFVFGSKVVYTCHNGYQMISRRNFRTCMAEGWDGVVPVCEASKCPPIPVDDNVQVFGDTEEATFGNVVRFSCKLSREILEGPKELYCDENGVWNGEPPKCKVVNCGAPKIENGFVLVPAQVYYEDEVLHFECNKKYQRIEERPSRCIKTGQRADWSPTPGCEPIKCKLDLPPLYGTSYTPEYTNVFLPGQRVRVTCGEMFGITDRWTETANVLCQDNGKWEVQPVCQEVTCVKRAPHVRNWFQYWESSKLHETVTYQCESGYKKPDGVTKATCTRGGWSPDPLCEVITCDKRIDPDADIIQPREVYVYNDRIQYVCKKSRVRYTLTCGTNGWDGRSGCPATCDKRIDPDAEIENPREVYVYNDQIQYVCKKSGKRYTLTCGTNGWDGRSGCPATCDKRIDPDADIENPKEVYVNNEQIEYVCKKSGVRYALTCRENGWDGVSGCPATTCPVAKVKNGFVVGPFNDTVYYSCNENYKPLSRGWWGEAKCNDKDWVGLHDCIEKTACPPPAIPNGKVTPVKDYYANNTSIVITCNNGYTSEISMATCTNGKWDVTLKSEICKAKFCKPPQRVYNAIVLGTYEKEYLPNTIITYECRENFLKEGEETIVCNDGEWKKNSDTKGDMKCTVPTGATGPQ